MCHVLEVSRSGYYEWRKRADKPVKSEQYLNQIRKIHTGSKRTYGSPRITKALKKQGVRISESSVARVMRRSGLVCKYKRKFRVTTNSKHHFKLSDNVLQRKFYVKQPNKVWVSDITYIPVNNTWRYLTVIMDLADRMIIGWSLSNTLDTNSTVLHAWRKAVQVRTPSCDLIFHSDQGVQYACDAFRKELQNHQVKQSMSRRGNCWDNAVAESFFKTLKTECLNGVKFTDTNQTYKYLFDYIEGWYNTRRMHSTLDYMTPLERFNFLNQESTDNT